MIFAYYYFREGKTVKTFFFFPHASDSNILVCSQSVDLVYNRESIVGFSPSLDHRSIPEMLEYNAELIDAQVTLLDITMWDPKYP